MNAKHVLRAARTIHSMRPDLTGEEFEEAVQNLLQEWKEQAARDREMFGTPEDTPTVANCDMWGTGEGRYHGVM